MPEPSVFAMLALGQKACFSLTVKRCVAAGAALTAVKQCHDSGLPGLARALCAGILLGPGHLFLTQPRPIGWLRFNAAVRGRQSEQSRVLVASVIAQGMAQGQPCQGLTMPCAAWSPAQNAAAPCHEFRSIRERFT